jgi:hypothetical protein
MMTNRNAFRLSLLSGAASGDGAHRMRAAASFPGGRKALKAACLATVALMGAMPAQAQTLTYTGNGSTGGINGDVFQGDILTNGANVTSLTVGQGNNPGTLTADAFELFVTGNTTIGSGSAALPSRLRTC